MDYLLIFLVNIIYLPTIFFGLVGDDASTMALDPFPIKRTKAFNIILHIVVAEYIYIAFGCSPVSLMTAILFSVHPFAVQVPVWIAGRQYGINALLFLMVLAYAPFHFLGGLGYFLSYVTAPCATLAFTPLVFIGTKFWPLLFCLPFIALLSYKRAMPGVQSKIKGDGWLSAPLPTDFDLLTIKLKKLILVVKTFWYYSFGSLFPIKNGFYNSYLATFGSSTKATAYWYSFNRHFWGGLFVMTAMFIFWVANFHNQIGFGILLFVLSLIPFLNFITVQQYTAPRYAYLPLIGFLIMLVNILAKFQVSGLLIMAGLFVFYVVKLLQVFNHYRTNNIGMYEYEIRVFPDNPRIWYFRYEHWLNKKNDIMAWSECAHGLLFLPEDCQLWFGLACATFNLGNIKGASFFLNNAEKFMLQADRKNMEVYIEDLKSQIYNKMGLTNTVVPPKHPFYRGVA